MIYDLFQICYGSNNDSKFKLCYFLGKIISMLIKGKKVNTSSVNKKKIDTSFPISIQPKAILQKGPVATKPKLSTSTVQNKANTKKPEQPKLELKKPQINKPIKQKEIKIQNEQPLPIPLPIQEPTKQPQAKKQDIVSQVIIRYNHYKDPFPCVNGILSFQPIQQKYSFGDVFKGNFIPILKIFKTNEEINPLSCGIAIEYSWEVKENGEYRLQIQQDEIEQSKYEKKIYKAQSNNLKHCQCNLKNRAYHDLTAEMKKLQAHELGGAKHRELLEQRDLEDILYSK